MDAMNTDCESEAPDGFRTRTRKTVMAIHSDTGAAMPVISSPKSSNVLLPMVGDQQVVHGRPSLRDRYQFKLGVERGIYHTECMQVSGVHRHT